MAHAYSWSLLWLWTASSLRAFSLWESVTVNDKSFKGEKFRGLLGSSVMWGKVSRFFFFITTFIHSWFSNSTKQLRAFQRKLCVNSSGEFSLKTVISILGNGREYFTDTCVCRFHEETWEEKSYSGSESELTASLFVSFFCKLLISWQKPSRLFATTVEYFLKYVKKFYGVNFQRSKSLAGKTFAVY